MFAFLIKSQTQKIIRSTLQLRFLKSKSSKNMPRSEPNSEDLFLSHFSFNPFINQESLNEFLPETEEREIEDKNQLSKSESRKLVKELNINELDYIKVKGFQRDTHLLERIENSKKIAQTLACLLHEHEYMNIQDLLNKFIHEVGYQNIFRKKVSAKEKQLFKKFKTILFQSIEDRESVEELLQLFSQSDPKLIQLEEVKKLYEFKNYDQDLIVSPSQKYKTMLESEKETKLQRIYPSKVYLKKNLPQTKLQVNKQTLQKIDQKLFRNKKIMDENIVFKKIPSKRQNIEKTNFGDNWVYAYDLPYDLDLEDAEKMIKIISESYGEIVEYSISPYQNMMERNHNFQTIYTIPDNFYESSKKNKIKLEVEKTEANSKLSQQLKTNGKRSLTTRILEKTKKEKQQKLNKSSMVFKFKNIQDKYKFLNLQMRLFGLNVGQYKNVRFEQAQSKNIITLNMLHWGSQSTSLIKFLNNALLPINIQLEKQDFIIMKSFIFIELDNFFEAYYAKNLLNNIIYEEQRLKAQIKYGPSRISEGEYKTSLELKHYDELVKRLSDIRSFYNDMYK